MRTATLAILGSMSWLSACGGGGGGDTPPDDHDVALAATPFAAIVAHEGDDLRYLQPDLGGAVEGGSGVIALYVTDSATETPSHADADHAGVKAAYAAMAGMPAAAWDCGSVMLGSQRAQHCRLDAAKLSLVFLGYPASVHDGSSDNSLLHLWEAKVTSVTNTAAPLSPTYSQASLIASVAAALDATKPVEVMTMEVAATHGDDHSDHMLVGALALLATAASTATPGSFAAYRGDNIASEAANTDAGTQARTTTAYGLYAGCATGCAACGTACTPDQLSTSDAALIQRHYAVAVSFGTATGPMMIGSDCVSLPQVGANGTVGSCTGAPNWMINDNGTLQSDAGICMKAILTGEIVGGACSDGGAGGRFFYDEDGHLWNGVVPGAQADMTLQHLECLGNVGGRPRDQLCGGSNAPVVDLPRGIPL